MRENTSAEGVVRWDAPSSRKVRNHSSLLRPNNSTNTQESAPQMVAQMAMAMMSSSLCRLLRSCLSGWLTAGHPSVMLIVDRTPQRLS